LAQKNALVVGGTSGIGRRAAEQLAARGEKVIITGRDRDRTRAAASEIGSDVSSLALDLSNPTELASKLSDIGQVDHLVLSAIERDQNSVRNYNIARAIRLVTIKLVGYTACVHALLPDLGEDASIVLLGGLAKDRPYPGSTTVSTVNGGVTGLVRTMATELAPVRVNALHPGVIGDTPAWSGKPEDAMDRLRARTPSGRARPQAGWRRRRTAPRPYCSCSTTSRSTAST
jgi:NAD(P)-dependent dehydrogenase (short-subunit alcohol dehydrogenase family)